MCHICGVPFRIRRLAAAGVKPASLFAVRFLPLEDPGKLVRVTLSDPAQRVLSELRRIPEAILFGSGEADAPFQADGRICSPMWVPRHIVDELLSLGNLEGGEIGARIGKVYMSFSLYDECRCRSQLPG